MAHLWPGTDPVGQNENRDRNLIESATSRPFQYAFGQEAYPTVLKKGVALFHSLIANHCFLNGNKRTAVIALDHFLWSNGEVLLLPNEEMYILAERTAAYKIRGLTLDAVLSEIETVIGGDVVALRMVEKEAEGDEKITKIYGSLTMMSAAIRNDPRNVLIPAPIIQFE